MCSLAQKVGLCGRLDPRGLIGHLSGQCGENSRPLGRWWRGGCCAAGCPSALGTPCGCSGAPGLVLHLLAPAKERVVLLCVQFPALSSCRQSLHGARCSLGGVSGALWKSLPVCWKCVWWGGGAYSRCRWALAFSVISLSVGGPRHACLQN